MKADNGNWQAAYGGLLQLDLMNLAFLRTWCRTSDLVHSRGRSAAEFE